MLIFRSHDHVPETITSNTLLGLVQEWVAINQTAAHHSQVSGWGLEGCLRPGDVVDLVDRSSQPRQDEILHQLVEEGTYLATRVILQALLPKLFVIARKRSTYSATLEDHLQIAISDLWQAVADYPIHRNRWVAMNLAGAVCRAFEPEIAEGSSLEALGELPDPDQESRDADLQLRQLFHDGLHQGVVAPEDLELLSEIYLEGGTSTTAAVQRGTSSAAIRKRCERIRNRLAAV